VIRHLHNVSRGRLADFLIETWALQGREGFLLSSPDSAECGTEHALDESCGVRYRFRWMPHREIRGDVAALERRGILNPRRDESRLFRDPRDPHGRHCFLCAPNIHECHPMERLIPLRLAGHDYYAGANFAWIERDHFTVMAAEHVDQLYARHTLDAMLALHAQTGGRFRVLFNGPGAGASIPWHLHYQITTQPMPIEQMNPDGEAAYPTSVRRFRVATGGVEQAHAMAAAWLQRDPARHSINILIAGAVVDAWIFVFPRDRERATATNKGLVGGFEVAGDFVLSSPQEEWAFRHASAATARTILEQICPEDRAPDTRVA
jgi:hypothetical protein